MTELIPVPALQDFFLVPQPGKSHNQLPCKKLTPKVMQDMTSARPGGLVGKIEQHAGGMLPKPAYNTSQALALPTSGCFPLQGHTAWSAADLPSQSVWRSGRIANAA